MELKVGARVMITNTKDVFSIPMTYELFVSLMGKYGIVVSKEETGVYKVAFNGEFGPVVFSFYDYNMEVIG